MSVDRYMYKGGRRKIFCRYFLRKRQGENHIYTSLQPSVSLSAHYVSATPLHRAFISNWSTVHWLFNRSYNNDNIIIEKDACNL
jgi:hypothetical protein